MNRFFVLLFVFLNITNAQLIHEKSSVSILGIRVSFLEDNDVFSTGNGNFLYDIEVLLPNNDHNSSQICGAKGESNIHKLDKISLDLQPNEDNSLIQIINALTDVLNEKFSMSEFTLSLIHI
mgnify:CR=1 FL=1